MGRRSLFSTVLMLVGALVCVQTVVTVLERQARPTHVDPSFYVEAQQAQFSKGSRYEVGPAPRLQPANLQPVSARGLK
jgi:hypothetical protein